MRMGETLLPEFDHEMAGTRRVLANVTDEVLPWKAHERSNSIGWVASHLADIPAWMDVCVNQDAFDVAPPGEPPHQTTLIPSVDAILETFDRNVAEARGVLAKAEDETLMLPWSLLKGGQVEMTLPRIAVVRSFILSHTIHHRAILCVYLRLNELPVPGLYGPSADDDSL